jgi:hypothetical protein
MNIAIGRSGWFGIASIGALVVTAAACSSSSSTPASPPSDASTPEDTGSSSSSGGPDGSSGTDGSSGADTGAPPVDGAAEASAADGGTSDGGSVTLTVMNFLSWCSVTINGGTASTGASVTASVPVGSTATLVATPAPNSTFQIGPEPWFGVTQNDGGAAAGTDNGSGATETSTAMVVVTGNQCVSVCCQEPNNSPTPCPATNPCP